MKDTPASFLLLLLLPLLLLLLPLLAPGGFLGSAHAQQCSPAFQTVDHQYSFITTAHRTEGDQTNTTMYVRPQRDLRVVLGVEGRDKNYTVEFMLHSLCFPGDWEWWELWVKVKLMRTSTVYGQVKSTYKLEVRTSMCVRPCTKRIYMQGLVSLHVWASGASQWRLDHPGTHCGTIPQWKTDAYMWTIPTCTDIKLPPISTTLPTPTTTPATPTPSLRPPQACTFPSSVPVGAIEGLGAAIVVVAVVLVVVVVVRKRLDVLPKCSQNTQ